ncbi:MAG: cyclodeaminase/cyclohydrolase family protein [Lachnospiraceae bacterium]|nr:cyclodeaminase/cyclohydrolase family protein [Lachnospiraceae bacterium]
MAMYEKKINVFLEGLASDAPVPGGGGACGLVGATAAALGSMVLSLTTGKKKYEAVQPEIDELIQKMGKQRIRLLNSIDRDAEAFQPLSEAYGMPRETPEDIERRDAVMARALRDAATAPLEMMELLLETAALLSRISEIGSMLAISDAGVGLACCRAALYGASLNVFINTKLMKDRTLADDMNRRVDEIIKEADAIIVPAYNAISVNLKGE